MDIYQAALKRLRADSRTLRELREEIGIPASTISDIRCDPSKNPRVDTVRKIAAYYFPKSVSA